jgi:hypothetical protein
MANCAIIHQSDERMDSIRRADGAAPTCEECRRCAQVFDADLTAEGRAFVRLAIKPWFRSKRSAKDPTNTTVLATCLARVRKK